MSTITYTVTHTAKRLGPRRDEDSLVETFADPREAWARFVELVAEGGEGRLFLVQRDGKWTLSLASAELSVLTPPPAWMVEKYEAEVAA